MGRNWAITIGINGYRNLQRLGYAKRDAESVRDYFSQELSFEQVYHFSDDSPPIPQDYGDEIDSCPTYATLRRFLRVRFEESFLRAGDNLWFFFAGHGVRHEDRDYLMPIDGDPGDVESTAIPLYLVTERLRRCGADNVILLVDACRSGSGRRDGVGVGEEKQQGVITLFSCSPRESSYEIDELQQGLFTHALLESLRIQGEGNCATVERLYQRLRYHVPQLSQQHQRPRQTPYGFVEPPTKYHLILLPRQANLTDIVTLKNDAYRAESRRELAQAKQLWIRVLIVSPADSDGIEAIERLARVPATPLISSSQQSESVTSSSGDRAGTFETISSSPVSPKPAQKTENVLASLQLFEFDVVTVVDIQQGRLGLGDRRAQFKRDRSQAQFFTENLGNGVTLEMVAIPGGIFIMGSPAGEGYVNEEPQHEVMIPTFVIGKFQVTQAQWKEVANLPRVNHALNPEPSRFKGGDRPVENMSWNDAVEFCDRLSRNTNRQYRLPSEAEWEYACRAGTTTPFHFGETITTDLVNYNGNYTYGDAPKGEYREKTTPVGSFSPNGFGLYDMHGNVWEWCADTWHGDYFGAPSDGSAWVNDNHNQFRVLRGGSWFNNPRYCRSVARLKLLPNLDTDSVGFRVVCGVARIH